jgi:hypothetical protein
MGRGRPLAQSPAARPEPRSSQRESAQSTRESEQTDVRYYSFEGCPLAPFFHPPTRFSDFSITYFQFRHSKGVKDETDFGNREPDGV